MMVAVTASGCFVGVPRNDSAQALLPLDFTFSCWRKTWAKNLVPDVRSLMRSLLVVVRQPFPVDVIELIQTHAKEVVQALPFCLPDIALDERIRHRSAHGRLDYFRPRTFPEQIEPRRVFCIPVTNQMSGPNAQILQPHGGITGLLKHPLLGWVECGRTHEDPAAADVDKHENISINPTSPSQDGLGEKVGCGQCLHVRVNKLFPLARRTTGTFVGDRVVICPFKDVADSRNSDANTQPLQFTLDAVVSPR